MWQGKHPTPTAWKKLTPARPSWSRELLEPAGVLRSFPGLAGGVLRRGRRGLDRLGLRSRSLGHLLRARFALDGLVLGQTALLVLTA